MLRFTFLHFLSVSIFYHAQSSCCPAASCSSSLSLHSSPLLHFLFSLRTLHCHPVCSLKDCPWSGYIDVTIDIDRCRHRQIFGDFSLEGQSLCGSVSNTRFSLYDMVKKEEIFHFLYTHLLWTSQEVKLNHINGTD